MHLAEFQESSLKILATAEYLNKKRDAEKSKRNFMLHLFRFLAMISVTRSLMGLTSVYYNMRKDDCVTGVSDQAHSISKTCPGKRIWKKRNGTLRG